MIKLIPPNAWGPGEGLRVALVKAGHTGFGPNDFGALVKRAGHPLAQWVRQNRPGVGETYVHAIALGSTESIGPNRNSDGYPNDMLRRDHPTFEKYAYWFRDHHNSRPELSYGKIKKAHYNADMQRVEVIAALNRTKEAAAANGGGGVADLEHQMLESGRDIDVSQSVRVPFDECSACHNRAKTRAQYCKSASCPRGGCAENLGRVFDDGFHLYVENPRGTFFDLSNVSRTRGADRTAFVTGKVANDDRLPGGAELAELMGLVAPEYLLDPRAYGALRCARKLAAATLPQTAALPWAEAAAMRDKAAGDAALSLDPGATDADRHARLGELTRAGVVLPPPAWLALVTGVAADKCARAFGGRAPDASRDLLARPDLHEVLEDGAPADSRISGEKWAALAPTPRGVEREAAVAVLRPTKAAHFSAAPEPVRAEAATRYLAYQANLLAAHENSANFDLLFSECARQNRNLSA